MPLSSLNRQTRVFTRSPGTRTKPTTTSSRRKRHPRVLQSMAPKRKSFARKLVCTAKRRPYSQVTPDLDIVTSKGRRQARTYHHYTHRRPHNKEVKSPLPPWSVRESHPCSPPPGAATSASMSQATANHPHLTTPAMVGRVEDLLPLLAWHQPSRLGQHFHHRKPPHLCPQPVLVDQGRQTLEAPGSRRRTRLLPSPLT